MQRLSTAFRTDHHQRDPGLIAAAGEVAKASIGFGDGNASVPVQVEGSFELAAGGWELAKRLVKATDEENAYDMEIVATPPVPPSPASGATPAAITLLTREPTNTVWHSPAPLAGTEATAPGWSLTPLPGPAYTLAFAVPDALPVSFQLSPLTGQHPMTPAGRPVAGQWRPQASSRCCSAPVGP